MLILHLSFKVIIFVYFIDQISWCLYLVFFFLQYENNVFMSCSGRQLKPNIMLNLDIFLRTRLVYVCNDLSFFMFFTVFGTIYNFGSLQCFSLYTNSSSLFVMLLYTHKNTSSMLYFVLFLYDIYIIEK